MMESGPPSDDKQPVQPQHSGLLQVLANEHWSLLATRSLTYSEALSRVSMFLGILSGAVIALALIAQADHFGPTFVLVAILLLSVVLFVGATTVVRLEILNHDDMAWVKGMNSIRRGYLDLHPDAEPYFITAAQDDFRGISLTQGFEANPSGRLGQLTHGIQTLPGMVSVIVAVVAAALAALVAHAGGAPATLTAGAAVAGFLAAFALLITWGFRSFVKFRAAQSARFPGKEQ